MDATESDFLRAPYNRRHTVGDAWLDDLNAQGLVRSSSPDDGLFDDMSRLDGPPFDAARLQPQVRDFYEHTARWRMEVWAQWNPLLAPGGFAVSALFGRRVRQLALPTSPLSVSRGMSSEVHVVTDDTGVRRGAAWLRTLRIDGSAVYSGFYRPATLPVDRQPHVAVSFPLEMGHVDVYLRPRVNQDGSLTLESRSHHFGEDGAYVSVLLGGQWYAAQVPLRERFRVYVDDEGVLRTDHSLHVGPARALRLHYRLEREPEGK
ncbi:hypothetical protein [Williamsia sterculiae]|nr:hypothetical protein [Williamsia sterculiae]